VRLFGFSPEVVPQIVDSQPDCAGATRKSAAHFWRHADPATDSVISLKSAEAEFF
jgi:hypothetical protein